MAEREEAVNLNERIVEYLHTQDAERLDPGEREFEDVEVQDIFVRDLGATRVYYTIRQYPNQQFAIYYDRLNLVVPPTEESVSIDVDTRLLPEGADAAAQTQDDPPPAPDPHVDPDPDTEQTVQTEDMPIAPAAQTDPTKCHGTKQDGTPCSRNAGWGTEHPGTGNCKNHESDE